jgi:hypothetical protein
MKAPLGIRVRPDGLQTSRPLGQWDDSWNKYGGESNLARLNHLRKSALPHLQKFESDVLEKQAATLAGRRPNLPGIDSRARSWSDAAKVRDDLHAKHNALSIKARDQVESLRPFQAPTTANEIALQQEYRAVLRQADSKTRSELLQQFEFKSAALAPGASPALSGIPPSSFAQLKERRLREVYPDQMAEYDDFLKADEVVANHLAALDAQIESERQDLGIQAHQPKPKPAPEPWE